MASISEKFAHIFHGEKATNGVPKTAELVRILSLPRRPPVFEGEEALNELFVRKDAKCPGCPVCRFGPPRLRPIQSSALWEAQNTKGLAAPIGVGHGKTLIALLLPAVLQADKAVILVKPSLKNQLLDVDMPAYARHFHIPTEKIHVVAYTELSSVKNADVLDRLCPDVIVADEVHLLRHKDSARTKRFLRFMKENPETRFCALSGTMTTRSLLDYAHFFSLSLKDKSPLPARYTELRDWSAAIDESPNKYPMPPGALSLLCNTGETVRDGYRRRVVETKGVVSTAEGALGVSLVIAKREFVPDAHIESALAHLRKYWSWNGEEIEDSVAFYRIAKQLACGFYYRWVWPGGVPDHEWLAARSAWHKEVRHFLAHKSARGVDSALLLARAAQAGVWASATWSAWARVKDRPPPPVEPVWFSDAFVVDAVKWGVEVKEGIIFYEHDAVGRKIAALGKLPQFAGGEDSVKISGVSPKTDPVIVCSRPAHGEGRNLQAYSQMLVTTFPANGTTAEQLIGRLHRPGQTADEVEIHTYLHTPELRKAMTQAISDATYIEETTGAKQKLLYATRTGFDV